MNPDPFITNAIFEPILARLSTILVQLGSVLGWIQIRRVGDIFRETSQANRLGRPTGTFRNKAPIVPLWLILRDSWSYVHDDDENSGGRILSLSERLAEAFQLLSADPLKLFVDRDLQWGDEWEKRIANALQQTTFFIPVVTPSYFRHDECRKELLKFAGAAKQFGVEQLLLPIYYVKVDELEAEAPPTDEAMAIIKRTQWVDFREVRLLDESDSEHRVLVDKLASRLLQAAEDIEDQPPLEPPEPAGLAEVVASSEVDGDGESDAEEGYLELLAKGEAALPLWTETVQAIGAEIAKFGELTDESLKEMQAKKKRTQEPHHSRADLRPLTSLQFGLQGPADRLCRSKGSEYVRDIYLTSILRCER